ncbi:MAG: hypothetical protein M1840_003065 [Geoglossum simile]|nr:MAG: hypothetical protein M1840_003065 [Geoglossum simile]
MEFVRGETLQTVWPSLADREKDVIVSELRGYISEMRKIQIPGGTQIGSVTGGPAVDRRQLGSISAGPFESEAEFNRWQLAQLLPNTTEEFCDLLAGTHKEHHKNVFTHGDLGWHNTGVVHGMEFEKGR